MSCVVQTVAALTGDPLYPLARTGPVVPAHPGDDQEQDS